MDDWLLSQAAQGQLGLILQRQNIDELVSARNIRRSNTKFEDIERIKNFAEVNLGLPVEITIRYVDVERDYLVWNVFAAPEFSTKPSSGVTLLLDVYPTVVILQRIEHCDMQKIWKIKVRCVRRCRSVLDPWVV